MHGEPARQRVRRDVHVEKTERRGVCRQVDGEQRAERHEDRCEALPRACFH